MQDSQEQGSNPILITSIFRQRKLFKYLKCRREELAGLKLNAFNTHWDTPLLIIGQCHFCDKIFQKCQLKANVELTVLIPQPIMYLWSLSHNFVKSHFSDFNVTFNFKRHFFKKCDESGYSSFIFLVRKRKALIVFGTKICNYRLATKIWIEQLL